MFSSQLTGLGDGCERVRDGFNADLISDTVSPSPYPGGKTCEDDCLIAGSEVLQDGVDFEGSAVLCPISPVFSPRLGSLSSDSICNCSQRKKESIRDVSFSVP